MKLEKYLVNAIIGPGKALRLPMIVKDMSCSDGTVKCICHSTNSVG